MILSPRVLRDSGARPAERLASEFLCSLFRILEPNQSGLLVNPRSEPETSEHLPNQTSSALGFSPVTSSS